MKRFLSLCLSLLLVMGIMTTVPVMSSAASVDDLEFTLYEKEYSVTNCSPDAKGSLTIPSTYNNLPVTEIGWFAFTGCEKLTKVTVPKTVTTISYCGFAGCSALDKIDIPDTLVSIGPNALDATGWFDSQKTGDVYLEHVLYGYKNAKTGNMAPENYRVSVKSGTKSIADCAFENQIEITDVILPSSIEYIGDYAFYNCSEDFTSVEIPKSVTFIGARAFGYCAKLMYDEEYDFEYYGIVANPNFVVYGTPGSVAEDYAKENGFKFKKACPHTSTKWVTDKAATVYKSGSKHKECTVCDRWLAVATIKQRTCSAPEIAKVSNTTSGVKITWNTVKGADSYRVYRKTSSSGWKYLDSTKKTEFTDKTAKSGTTYYYTVRAKNEAGLGSYNTKGLSTKCIAAPKLSKIQNVSGGLKITWGKVSGAEGYYVYRKASGEKAWTRIATVKGGSVVSYKDAKVSSGKVYTYTVKAYAGKVSSGHFSEGIKLRYLATPAVKAVTSTTNGIKFTWGKVAGAEGYYVYRKTGTGSWKRIATVEGNTYYLDKTAKKGTTYTYTVKAFKGTTYSYYNTTGLKIKDKY